MLVFNDALLTLYTRELLAYTPIADTPFEQAVEAVAT
jgi:hypothetical protein